MKRINLRINEKKKNLFENNFEKLGFILLVSFQKRGDQKVQFKFSDLGRLLKGYCESDQLVAYAAQTFLTLKEEYFKQRK